MACGVEIRIVELEDVVFLLRADVKQADGQEAWGQKDRVNRAVVNKVLNGHRQPAKSIINTLELRMVFALHRSPVAE